MVDALHRAGLEVILDVVFNHTAEAGPDGPALCFRGIDNTAYYRVVPGNPGVYYDTTGCGNSLNADDPITLQLMMDSLRYWILEMHADGFRFDLAPTLARQDGAFDKVSAFLDMVAQDPVVSRVKLTAEPWDVGQMDSYDLGRFPPLWREWNGKYRDTMRDFWRSQPVSIGEFATRFAGSSDLYGTKGRRPTASVNLITVHDGFTLRDLVSYDDKHNEANGEDNIDGTKDNRSWNCGAEGPTADPGILALRARQSRAMLTTLMLSFGVPLLLGGDEMGRTQGGNNNAYCQDNEITWFDWASADTALLEFTRHLIAFRRAHPVFRRRRFLAGAEASELQWFTPAGTPMDGGNWADPNARAIAIYLDGSDDPDRAEDGTFLVDDDFLVLVNSWWEPLSFVLPATCPGAQWQAQIDSYDPAAPARAAEYHAGHQVTVGARSIIVLILVGVSAQTTEGLSGGCPGPDDGRREDPTAGSPSEPGSARPTPREPGHEEAAELNPQTREKEKEADPGDRYLIGSVKEEVEAGREFFLSLQVKVTRPDPAAGVSQSHMLIERRGDLVAVLVADPLFSVLTADKVIVPVPQEGEGPEKGFTLRPQHAGTGWLRVDVHRGTQALTTFRFRVTASEARTESETRSARIGIPQTAAPSGLMKILLAGRQERTIQLLVGDMHLDDHPLEIGESALREQLQKITAQLNEFGDSTARGSITRKRGELHGLGKQIYSRLLPGPFVEEFRAHRPSATSLVIQGSSPLPWELMADSDDDRFLAEELRVTRWLNGSQPGAPIRLGNAIFACTDGVGGARNEIEEIGRLLCSGQEPGIIAESVQLQQRMRAGDFDLFHFAGHTKEDKSPETTALDFGNDDYFTLNYMADVPSETLRRSRPIIFLNACGSASGLGRQTLFEDWAEMFIKRGAGAFIGSLWNIRSDTANMFGIDVYQSIREGAASTLGEAVDFARRSSTGDPSDPTRLAYALYGRDNAQVILNP